MYRQNEGGIVCHWRITIFFILNKGLIVQYLFKKIIDRDILDKRNAQKKV